MKICSYNVALIMSIIRVGEETGELSKMLSKKADFYEIKVLKTLRLLLG